MMSLSEGDGKIVPCHLIHSGHKSWRVARIDPVPGRSTTMRPVTQQAMQKTQGFAFASSPSCARAKSLLEKKTDQG